ncbi:orf122b [Fagus crenata]
MKSKSRSSSVISKMSRENYKRWPSHTCCEWGLFASGSSTCRTTTPGRNPPFCLKLVLKMDLISLHALRSSRLLVRHQNLAKLSRYMAAVFTDASSDVVRQATPYPKSLRSLASRVPTNAFGFT